MLSYASRQLVRAASPLHHHSSLAALTSSFSTHPLPLMTPCSSSSPLPHGGSSSPAQRRLISALSVTMQGSQSGIHTIGPKDLNDPDPQLAYELVQGTLVQWTRPGSQHPPTIVLLHGILGQRRNMSSFAKLIVERYPAWQILLVDLRCHGDSCSLPSNTHEPPHTLDNAAKDVLALLRHLKLFPHALVGHSFGGKVVMAMVRQFGTRLPRPLQVWVLDSLPGHVRSGELGGDHPERLIDTLRSLDLSRELFSRTDLVNVLVDKGFSKMIAQWAATNLKQLPPSNSGSNGQLKWGFDLDGIKSLYRSYEEDDLYPLLENPPLGLKLDFVKAEHSSFRWGGDDEDRIKSLGHHVHVLPRSGHWVHTDNPNGLLSILEISFQDLSARLAAASKN